MERNLRIVTGVVLYLFIATHLLNVSLGVISAELIEETRPLFMGFWAFQPVSLLLLTCLIVHGVLGLKVLFYRNTLQMTASDGVQFASGFLIPPLLIPHVWGIIAMVEVFGIDPTYPILMQLFWIDNPLEGLRQVLLIVIVWVHGSIGIFIWLRLKSWWNNVAPLVYPLIVLVPVLALLGFVEGGNLAIRDYETRLNDQQSIYADSDVNAADEPSEEQVEQANLEAQQFAENYAFVIRIKWYCIFGYLAILAGVLAARHIRLSSHGGEVTVHYDDGTVISAPVGHTFLELSHLNAVPHANLCKGRGRCGTCRVRIVDSSANLPAPSDLEASALVFTASDPDVRLACQCVPGAGEVRIERLMEADMTAEDLRARLRAERMATHAVKAGPQAIEEGSA